MPALTDLTGLFGVACLIAALAIRLPRVQLLPKRNLAVLSVMLIMLSCLPLGGLPLAAYVRGATGDLSITMLIIIWRALLRPYWPTPQLTRSHQHLLLLIAACAIIFYPMTLGMSMFDPYRLGYGSVALLGSVLLVASLAWLEKSYLISLCLSLAVLAWSMGWYESNNLWDYLLDPLLAAYAIGTLAGIGPKPKMRS
jgi:hypothetical protein